MRHASAALASRTNQRHFFVNQIDLHHFALVDARAGDALTAIYTYRHRDTERTIATHPRNNVPITNPMMKQTSATNIRPSTRSMVSSRAVVTVSVL